MSLKTTGEDESSSSTPSNSPCRRGPQNGDNNDKAIHLLSQLHLPRMNMNENPSLRILVVADLDLKSAAALAEHALENQEELGGGNVDCIIACGPFVRDEDVRRQYLQGRNRNIKRKPHERSRQETAALEGLMSSVLSQLESIVCRVIYVPHPTDPATTLVPSDEDLHQHLRLTSNSVNVHEQWLPLAPGIGCCGFAGVTEEQQERLYGPDQTRVHHGPEYQEALTRILDLAPPSSPPNYKEEDGTLPRTNHEKDVSFSSPCQQAILVTHVGMANNNNKTNQTEQYDVFEWPRDHFSFLESSQSRVILNIAAAPCPFFEQQIGGKTILVSPGSLLENGDYCLIDVGIHQLQQDCCDDDTVKQEQGRRRMFSWRVDRVQFRNMNQSA